MSTHKTAETPPASFTNQRVIRTILQTTASLITGAATLIMVLAVFTPAFLEAIREILPPHWYAASLIIVAFISTLAGVFTKIMAIPHVNTFLTQYGAGTQPRTRPDTEPEMGKTHDLI